MRKFLAATLLLSTLFFFPKAAFALEGVGPRATVVGEVIEVRITEKQAFDEVGGEFSIRATNGQIVNIVVDARTVIITEGQSSRRQLIAKDIIQGMTVRVRGWRVGTDSITASLFIITNIANNPTLTVGGTLQLIGGDSISVLLDNGQSKTYKLTNETEVNLSYTAYGSQGLVLTGKQVLLTLNPTNTSQVRILRLTGNKPIERGFTPATVELLRR